MWSTGGHCYQRTNPEHPAHFPPPPPRCAAQRRQKIRRSWGSTWAQPHSWGSQTPRRQRNPVGRAGSGVVVSRGSEAGAGGRVSHSRPAALSCDVISGCPTSSRWPWLHCPGSPLSHVPPPRPLAVSGPSGPPLRPAAGSGGLGFWKVPPSPAQEGGTQASLKFPLPAPPQVGFWPEAD